MNPPLTTSDKGRAFIRGQEGEVLHSYQDQRGIWTIGVGCTGPDIGPGMTITREQADQMFADRLAKEFEPAVIGFIGHAPTTQGQFDAMVSLAFNIGDGAFGTSHVLKYHREGNYPAAARAFLLFDKTHIHGVLTVDPPLHRRRLEEGDIYLADSPEEATA